MATKLELEAQLREKSIRISEELAAIKQEVSRPLAPLKETVKENPVAAVAVVIGLGVAVGLWWRGGRKPVQTTKRHAFEGVTDALASQIENLYTKGGSVKNAVRQALSSEAPPPPPPPEVVKASVWGGFMGMLLNALTRALVRAAVDVLKSRSDAR